MQAPMIVLSQDRPIQDLPLVRTFKKVIEERDIRFVTHELYQFFNLYCGFIAHFDLNGFKAAYGRPIDFADVFIGHFDSKHRYFNGAYPCHEEPYKETGFTKADIKREFFRIVYAQKEAIGSWVEAIQRNERYTSYLKLKSEFEPLREGIEISCDICANSYSIAVSQDGQIFQDFRTVCCVFCGHPIKFKKNLRLN